jgi:energy coupling factor transporter S component ThiW
MKNSKSILKMVVLAMLIAIGVVISPILRVEGMCPMAHFINIVCSVFMGPWYSLLCAFIIGVIRMVLMGIPPLALTGAIFGAFLSGVFYKLSKGKLLCAVLGEIIGTGIIGAIVSYPVMTLIWGKDGLSLFFYVPSFICGTLIGGSIAYFFLRKYADGGMLAKTQDMLGSPVYSDKGSVLTNAISIATFGAILFVVFLLVPQIFKSESEVWSYLSYGSIILFVVLAVVYYLIKKLHKAPVSDSGKQ